MYKILVLLAAYNGRKWIDEQLVSIFSQEYVQVDILISVDLSSDDTFEYIKDNYPRVNLLPYGKKYGAAGNNFYRLILDAKFDNYDYIAFSDQDDIWLADKLAHAVNMIDKYQVDAYSSNVTAFWDDGRQCLINKSQSQVEFDYFFEAAGPGCTYVFCRRLGQDFQQFLKTEPMATDVALHDWLIYAFARSKRYQWFIDSDSKMLYRQHSSNQVGANVSLKAAFKRYCLVKDGWYKQEIIKLVKLFGSDYALLNESIIKSRCLPSFYIISNVNKLRRRNRDRLVLLIFHLFRFI